MFSVYFQPWNLCSLILNMYICHYLWNMNAQFKGQSRTLHQSCALHMLCTLGWWWSHAASHAVSQWWRTHQLWLICSFAFYFLQRCIFPTTPGPIWERLIGFGLQTQTFCDPLLKCCVNWASVTQRRQSRGSGVWIVARATVAVVQKSAVQP